MTPPPRAGAVSQPAYRTHGHHPPPKQTAPGNNQVLLAADGVLANYADVAEKLRPGGEWAVDSTKRPRDDELGLVEPYLGIFERIFISVTVGQVEDEVADQLYGYRSS